MAQVISNKVYESIQPYDDYSTASGKILYANKYADTAPVEMPSDIKELLDSDVGLNGTNLLIQLKNKFLFMPNGPWYVDSRDGVIYIHNRKFQEEPVHTYVYQNENGEVLKVHFQTNWVTKSTKVVLHEGIDPITKKTEGIKTEILSPEDAANQKPESSFPLVYDYHMEYPGLNIFNKGDVSTRAWTVMEHHPEELIEYSLKQRGEVMAYELEKSKAQREYMQKVASDPSIGIKDAENKLISSMDAQESQMAFKKTLEDEDLPDNTRRQLYRLAHDYELAKNPPAFEAKLAEITDGMYYYQKVDDTTVPVKMDPLDYDRAEVINNSPGYYGQYAGTGKYTNVDRREARFRNLDKMRRDPNLIILEGTVKIDTLHDEGPVEVQVIRKGTNTIQVPLIKVFQNYFGRYGGIKTYLWAANANRNGGLKSKEKEVKVLMTVVGRPMLRSSMVINIQNIGKRWSGAWYVKKCTHKMNVSNGYTCELELIRNTGISGSSTSRLSLSSENVLHVYTDENGKTTYGKKPEDDKVSAFMATYNKQEIAFYAEGMLSGKRDAVRDVAIKMAYNAKYANDPYKLDQGTTRTKNVLSNKDGITTLSVTEQIDPAAEGISEEDIQYYEKQLEDPKVLGRLKYYQSEAYKRLQLQKAAQEAKEQSQKTMKDKADKIKKYYFDNMTGLGLIINMTKGE